MYINIYIIYLFMLYLIVFYIIHYTFYFVSQFKAIDLELKISWPCALASPWCPHAHWVTSDFSDISGLSFLIT